MAVNRAHRVVAGVPVGRLDGAAPERELREEQHFARLAHQRKVVHQDGRHHPIELLQPGPGVGQPVAAPGVAGGIGLARQQELVGGDDVAALGDCQPFGLGGRPLRKEGVVVEQEHRHDGGRAALLGPHRIGVLGGDNAHLVAHLDKVVVAGPAEHLHRILAGGPQFVVARHPDDLGEPAAQQVQRPPDVVGAFGDVTGDDQPVVSGGRVQRLGDRLVAGVPGMQVADRPEGGCHDPSAYLRSIS